MDSIIYTSPNTIAQEAPCHFSLDRFQWSVSEINEESPVLTVLCWNHQTDGIKFRYYLSQEIETIDQILELEPFQNSTPTT